MKPAISDVVCNLGSPERVLRYSLVGVFDVDFEVCGSKQINPVSDFLDVSIKRICYTVEEINNPPADLGAGSFEVDDLLVTGFKSVGGLLSVLK